MTITKLQSPFQVQKICDQEETFRIKQVSESYLIFGSVLEFSVIWDSQGNVRLTVSYLLKSTRTCRQGYMEQQKCRHSFVTLSPEQRGISETWKFTLGVSYSSPIQIIQTVRSLLMNSTGVTVELLDTICKTLLC